MKSCAFKAACAALALAAMPAPAPASGSDLPGAVQTGGFAVPLDEVRTLRFEQPAATVYVGNPLIAEITIVDQEQVFVLGRNFGTTNVLALDANGREIANVHVTVFGRTGSMVTLHRGNARVSYACAAARCETTVVPGDAKGPFDDVMSQVNKRQAASLRSLQGEAGGE